MKKQIVLCDLQCDNRQMTTWLDKHPKLTKGVQVTLDGQTDLWTVKTIYESAEPHYASDFDFHRKWDNNNYDKHEGLFNGK
jgi:hypothetical protein